MLVYKKNFVVQSISEACNNPSSPLQITLNWPKLLVPVAGHLQVTCSFQALAAVHVGKVVAAALGLAHAALGGQVTAREHAGRVGGSHVLLPVALPVRVSAALWKPNTNASQPRVIKTPGIHRLTYQASCSFLGPDRRRSPGRSGERHTCTVLQLGHSPSSEGSAHPPSRLRGDQGALRSSTTKKKNGNFLLEPGFSLSCLFSGVKETQGRVRVITGRAAALKRLARFQPPGCDTLPGPRSERGVSARPPTTIVSH